MNQPTGAGTTGAGSTGAGSTGAGSTGAGSTGAGTTGADVAGAGPTDPDQIAVAAAGCQGVVRLASGPLATHLPGRTVPGVAVRDGTVVVAVVAAYGPPLQQTAERVRAAVRRVAPDATVDVRVDGVELPGEKRDE